MQIVKQIRKRPASVLLHTQMPLLVAMGLYLLFSIQRDFSVNALRYFDCYVEAFRSYIAALILSIIMILLANLMKKQAE